MCDGNKKQELYRPFGYDSPDTIISDYLGQFIDGRGG